MKIKILTPLAGLRFSYAPGDVVDHEDDESRRLIRAGFAEPVKRAKATAPEEETADGDAGETTDDGGDGDETADGDEGEQRGEAPPAPELFKGKPLAAYDGMDRKALIKLPGVDRATADKILAARAKRDEGWRQQQQQQQPTA